MVECLPTCASICAIAFFSLAVLLGAIALRWHAHKGEEVARESLRMELLARWKPYEYALNVSPVGVKAAPAWEYDFAMHTGLKDFWQRIPVLKDDKHLPIIFEVEADVADGKRRFARIDDGCSNTYVPLKLAHVVPDGYDCTVATPEEIRDVVHYAKGKARHGDAKRNDIE